MRVLINMQSASGQRTGVGHYTWELTHALQARVGKDIRPYPTPWESRVVGWYERQSALFESADRRAWTRWARGRMLQLARVAGARSYTERLGCVVNREGIDLYHEPFFMPLECNAPAVATIHDLSVILYPAWHRAETVRLFERHFASGLNRCVHLIAVSKFTQEQIVRHLGWPLERTSVTYNGRREHLRPLSAEECTPVLRRLGLEPGYLLHVGTLEPRKNLGMLLRAYCALPGAVRERHPLVLAGSAGWNSGELHDYLRGAAREENVRWLGYVQDEDFAALYSAARSLVFPTLYEGFGMPTVEMLACGGAVLASTAGAVAETVGAQAHLIDPHDEDGWRDAMLRVCTDQDWWQSLRRGAEEVARPFTWTRCAHDTLNAYHAALGNSVKRAA